MKITKEWFRQFGRLNLSISDEGYRYSGPEHTINEQDSLDDLYIDVREMLWFSCKSDGENRAK
jgi:hypothetical protein